MLKYGKRYGVLCLLCFVISGVFNTLLAAEKNPQKKLLLIKQELIQINRNLNQTKKTKNKQRKKIQTFDVEIADFHQKLKQVEIKKTASNKAINDLEKGRRVLVAHIAENKKSLSEMSRALYTLGDENYLKILMNHNDASEQSRIRTYYDYFYQAFTQQQGKLSADLAELTKLEAALIKKLAQYNRLLKKFEKQTESLKAKRKAKKAYLAKLNKQIKNKQRQMTTLKSSRKTLEKLVKALKKRKYREKMQRLSGISFAKKKGRLQWPVKGKVRRKYGQTRANTGLKWRGLLFSAKAGERVRAVSAGTVVFSDWLSGYGFVLILDHGKNYMSLYGHNQQLLKAVGDKVSSGDIVAEAGSSGRLGKPGLYFEIRYKGKPINPVRWMAAR